jgi:hypothetical protein
MTRMTTKPKTREWCASVDTRDWSPIARQVLQMAINRFEELTALKSDNPLASALRFWLLGPLV